MGVRQYTWSGSAWVEVGSAVGFQDSTTTQKGLVQLSDAYLTTDSTKAASQTAAYNAWVNSNKVTYATTAPSSPKTGDIWIDSDDSTTATTDVYQIISPTSNYTLATNLSDAYDRLIRMNVSTANTLTIPPDSTANYPTGIQIRVAQVGSGKTQIVAGSGVTINSKIGSTIYFSAQWGLITLIKTDANTWLVFGDVSAT